MKLLREIFLARTLGISAFPLQVSSAPRDQSVSPASLLPCRWVFFCTEPPGKAPVQRPPQLVLKVCKSLSHSVLPFLLHFQLAVCRVPSRVSNVECSVPLPVPFPFCLMRSDSGISSSLVLSLRPLIWAFSLVFSCSLYIALFLCHIALCGFRLWEGDVQSRSCPWMWSFLLKTFLVPDWYVLLVWFLCFGRPEFYKQLLIPTPALRDL